MERATYEMLSTVITTESEKEFTRYFYGLRSLIIIVANLPEEWAMISVLNNLTFWSSQSYHISSSIEFLTINNMVITAHVLAFIRQPKSKDTYQYEMILDTAKLDANLELIQNRLKMIRFQAGSSFNSTDE